MLTYQTELGLHVAFIVCKVSFFLLRQCSSCGGGSVLHSRRVFVRIFERRHFLIFFQTQHALPERIAHDGNYASFALDDFVLQQFGEQVVTQKVDLKRAVEPVFRFRRIPLSRWLVNCCVVDDTGELPVSSQGSQF